MSKKLFNPIIYEDLIKDEEEHYTEIFLLSIFGIIFYIIALLNYCFLCKKNCSIKIKTFYFYSCSLYH